MTYTFAGVMSFAGHVYGSFPPGRMGHVAGCARHLLNMLRAHGKAYDVIKAMPGGAEMVQVQAGRQCMCWLRVICLQSLLLLPLLVFASIHSPKIQSCF